MLMLLVSRTHSRSFYTPVSLLLAMLLEPTSIFFHGILGIENCLILLTCPLNRAFFSWGPQINIVQSYLSYICVCVLSYSVMSKSLQPHGLQPTRLLCPWNFPGKNTGMGCHFLLQGFLPGIKLTSGSPALASGFLATVPPEKCEDLLVVAYKHLVAGLGI